MSPSVSDRPNKYSRISTFSRSCWFSRLNLDKWESQALLQTARFSRGGFSTTRQLTLYFLRPVSRASLRSPRTGRVIPSTVTQKANSDRRYTMEHTQDEFRLTFAPLPVPLAVVVAESSIRRLNSEPQLPHTAASRNCKIQHTTHLGVKLMR